MFGTFDGEQVEHEDEKSEPTEVAGLGKGTLNHPASGQEYESSLGFLEFDDHQSGCVGHGILSRLFSRVTLVDVSDLHLPAACTFSTKSAT